MDKYFEGEDVSQDTDISQVGTDLEAIEVSQRDDARSKGAKGSVMSKYAEVWNNKTSPLKTYEKTILEKEADLRSSREGSAEKSFSKDNSKEKLFSRRISGKKER